MGMLSGPESAPPLRDGPGQRCPSTCSVSGQAIIQSTSTSTAAWQQQWPLGTMEQEATRGGTCTLRHSTWNPDSRLMREALRA